MILADTSIWVEHLHEGSRLLAKLLEEGMVLIHPFIIGELACGSMANRREIPDLLAALPVANLAQHTEVMRFVEKNRLYGCGIGWIDAHLLASALLSDAPILTSDRKLRRVAGSLGIAYRNRANS
jgi:predicted nucleic acid-binding protein